MDETTWTEAAREVRKEIEGKMWSEPNEMLRMIWMQLYKKASKLQESLEDLGI